MSNLLFDDADLNGKKSILFCIPYGGGWSTMFNPWESYFGDDTLILPLKFPGRGERLDEESFGTIEELIEYSYPLVAEYDLPYGFYGGCFGGLCAYEIMKKLEKNYGKKALKFYTNSLVSPDHLPNEKPIGDLPDDLFRKELLIRQELPAEVLEDDEVMEFLMPGIRADYIIFEGYKYQAAEKLDTDIHIFLNPRDNDKLEQYDSWKGFTCKTVDSEHLSYNNLFNQESQCKIAELVSRDWQKVVDSYYRR